MRHGAPGEPGADPATAVNSAGVDEYGRLCVYIGPMHPLAKIDAAGRSKLVAASPALLAALKECYEVLAGGSYHNAPCVERAQEAIEGAS